MKRVLRGSLLARVLSEGFEPGIAAGRNVAYVANLCTIRKQICGKCGKYVANMWQICGKYVAYVRNVAYVTNL